MWVLVVGSCSQESNLESRETETGGESQHVCITEGVHCRHLGLSPAGALRNSDVPLRDSGWGSSTPTHLPLIGGWLQGC